MKTISDFGRRVLRTFQEFEGLPASERFYISLQQNICQAVCLLHCVKSLKARRAVTRRDTTVGHAVAKR